MLQTCQMMLKMQCHDTWLQKIPVGSGKHLQGVHEQSLSLSAKPYYYAINIFTDYIQLNCMMTICLMDITTDTSDSTNCEV
jgi:hypothetical protein